VTPDPTATRFSYTTLVRAAVVQPGETVGERKHAELFLPLAEYRLGRLLGGDVDHVALVRRHRSIHVADGVGVVAYPVRLALRVEDRKSTRLNSSHVNISYA